jgi:hypothetical protein
VVAPRGFGRIRLQRVKDVSKASLIPFVQASVEPGATVRTQTSRREKPHGSPPMPQTTPCPPRVQPPNPAPERAHNGARLDIGATTALPVGPVLLGRVPYGCPGVWLSCGPWQGDP